MPSRNSSSPNSTIRGATSMPSCSARSRGISEVLSVTIRTVTLFDPLTLVGHLRRAELVVVARRPLLDGHDVVVERLPAVLRLDLLAGEPLPHARDHRLGVGGGNILPGEERDDFMVARAHLREQVVERLGQVTSRGDELAVGQPDILAHADGHAVDLGVADGPRDLARA